MFDDNGNPIPESLRKFIEEQGRISNDLRFPHLSNKFSGGREPENTQWLLNYFVYRQANLTPSDSECKAYYEAIGVDSEDDINRFRGALLGCALGDALGTTLEFQPPGSFQPIDDIVGGGPFGLKVGEWTDDTSMMYCLAHSLVRKKGFDLDDQISLYCRWWKDGVFSVNGKCFDIGNTVQEALSRYLMTKDPCSGSKDPMSAGNGSLMRLAPVPIFFYGSFESAVEYGGRSSLTTHAAIEAVDACRYFSGLVWGALHGASKEELLNGIYSPIKNYWELNPLCSSLKNLLLSESYKDKISDQLRASGYVMHTLESALWAFWNSSSFKDGALKAVNLGEDADTTGAVYGQLAGAYYGERQLPFDWIKKLSESHVFYHKAQELKEVACSKAR